MCFDVVVQAAGSDSIGSKKSDNSSSGKLTERLTIDGSGKSINKNRKSSNSPKSGTEDGNSQNSDVATKSETLGEESVNRKFKPTKASRQKNSMY
jgi:hypothetical protein